MRLISLPGIFHAGAGRRHLKRSLAAVLALSLLILSACSSGGSNITVKSFTPTEQREGISLLTNPYRGFFYMCGFMLDEKSTPSSQKEKFKQHIAAQNMPLYLLQINLAAYADSDLSDVALSQVGAIFEAAREEGVTTLVRFVYDWDYRAELTEPYEIAQIAAHMEQLAPVVNEYKDIILLIQGTFTGNCGEMNNSRFETVDDYKYLINTLADNIAPSIFLSVRTPWQQRGVTDSFRSVTADTAFDGSMPSRLGLFNDGMLGSESDLGSYGNVQLDETTDTRAMGTREDELAFQERLCLYVPNGGEVISGEDSSLIAPENAIRDMSRMHITYLNRDHDLNAINLWKKEFYHGDSAFDGASMYEYINAHLGYRYYIAGAKAQQDNPGSTKLKVSIDLNNMGFAPCYRALDSAFYFIPLDGEGNPDAKAAVEIPVELDTRSIAGGTVINYSFELDMTPLTKSKTRDYQLCFGLRDPVLERQIQFANDYRCITEDELVILGELELE